jgi:hypothetical protein
MAFDDFRDSLDDGDKERSRWIGIYIGLLAVLLAICAMLGGNTSKDATRANIEVSDTYNFYQAKNARQVMLRLHVEQMQAFLDAQPNVPPEVRARIDTRIAEHKATAERYESEPKTGDGKKELLAKAKRLEHERDTALAKDPYFDWSQALLQIAIVLASVAIITGGRLILLVSGLAGLIGTALLINGHLLLFRIPFIG